MIEKKNLEAIVAGASLRECREERGLSIRALSDLADISRKQIGYIENGKSNPTIGTYIKLLNAMDFGFDIIDLTKEA